MLIIGEKQITKEVANGTFECPVCDSRQGYRHRQIKQYFSLFFIPLLPMNDSANYVICNHCLCCFDPRILTEPAVYSDPINHRAMRRALCYLLAGYGDSSVGRQQLSAIFQTYNGITLSPATVAQELQAITGGDSPTLPMLHKLSPQLSTHAKHQLLLACYQLCQGLTEMSFEDRVRINTLAAELELSIPEVNYLISTLGS